MELTLGTGLSALPGIGDARARKLAKLGLSGHRSRAQEGGADCSCSNNC